MGGQGGAETNKKEKRVYSFCGGPFFLLGRVKLEVTVYSWEFMLPNNKNPKLSKCGLRIPNAVKMDNYIVLCNCIIAIQLVGKWKLGVFVYLYEYGDSMLVGINYGDFNNNFFIV